MSASTLVVLAALSLAPDQQGGLALTNVRGTHGLLGLARTEKKVLPGDSVFVCFDIQRFSAGTDIHSRFGSGGAGRSGPMYVQMTPPASTHG